MLGLYFYYGISNFVHNPQTGSTSSDFTVLPHCYSGVCLSVTVNYMCILKKSIGKSIPGYSQHVQHIKLVKHLSTQISFLGEISFIICLKMLL